MKIKWLMISYSWIEQMHRFENGKKVDKRSISELTYRNNLTKMRKQHENWGKNRVQLFTVIASNRDVFRIFMLGFFPAISLLIFFYTLLILHRVNWKLIKNRIISIVHQNTFRFELTNHRQQSRLRRKNLPTLEYTSNANISNDKSINNTNIQPHWYG